jgi:hypothetical protein
MIERITPDEKLRYIAAAVELCGLRKVKWRFLCRVVGSADRAFR